MFRFVAAVKWNGQSQVTYCLSVVDWQSIYWCMITKPSRLPKPNVTVTRVKTGLVTIWSQNLAEFEDLTCATICLVAHTGV